MSDILNIGVLGFASIAERSIVPAILNLPERFNLVGIARRDREKALSVAKKFNLRKQFSYESLLEEPVVNAVYVPLPNALHNEWINKSLDKGLHVLVEKPLACDFDQVNALTEIAASRNLALVENFQFRFHPQFKKLLELISQESIGTIRYLNSTFAFPPLDLSNNIRYVKKLGGGSLLDAGTYPLKICNLLMGGSLRVCSAALNFKDDHEVDLWGSAHLLSTETLASAHVTFGFDNVYRCCVEVCGSKGRVLAERIFTAPPNYSPVLDLYDSTGKFTRFDIAPANHFELILEHFHRACFDNKLRQAEYKQNLEQSFLVQSVLENSVTLGI